MANTLVCVWGGEEYSRIVVPFNWIIITSASLVKKKARNSEFKEAKIDDVSVICIGLLGQSR